MEIQMHMKMIVFAACFLSAVSAAAAEPNFDVDAIPFLDAKYKSMLIDHYNKIESKSAFTLAVSPSGNDWSYTASSSITSDERQKKTLQRCEHLAGTPCVLVVVDGTMTGNTSAHESTIKYRTQFSVLDIPFIEERQRNWATRYLRVPKHKALAMRGDGDMSMVSGKSTKEEAKKSALSQCLARFKKPCFIYSVDDTVYFNMKTNIFPK